MSAALTIRMDEDVLARLDAAAAEQGIARDSIVEMALEDHLATLLGGPADLDAWQLELVDEGLAAAERGDFASPADVDAVFATGRG